MKRPKISVLLPVYNGEAFLAETLHSLINQTFENFEIIAVNDGSTDRSASILKKYQNFDSRIKIVNQENKGLVAALNNAVQVAQGEYLARIDADDIALPRRFEFQKKVLDNKHNCILVASNFDVINEDGEVIYNDSVPTKKSDIMRAMLFRNPIAHGSIMMRRSAFIEAGGYNPDCGPTEDYELWSKMVHLGDICVLPQTLFRWRINPDGITSTKSKVMEEFMKVNLTNFGKTHHFSLVPRRRLVKNLSSYLTEDPKHGAARKNVVLRDLTELSFIQAKNGRIWVAIKQLFIICSTGRSGLRTVKHRINNFIQFRLGRKTT